MIEQENLLIAMDVYKGVSRSVYINKYVYLLRSHHKTKYKKGIHYNIVASIALESEHFQGNMQP